MLLFCERLEESAEPFTTLTLSFEKRQKSRQRVVLDNGQQAGLQLMRGIILRGGDLLVSEDKKIVRINAAKEKVSTVFSVNQLQLMRACYHLGNRHVPLQIFDQGVRYQQDHVLDEMIEHLGLSVQHEIATFEPEGGAFSRHSHHHA